MAQRPEVAFAARTAYPDGPAPPLRVPLVGGGTFDLAQENPENFTLVLFYRGLHCPICQPYVQQFEQKLQAFKDRGIEVVAVSMETEDRAVEATKAWSIQDLRVGYDLDEETARAWGLFISKAIRDDEPAVFNEPGAFLVRPDGTIHGAWVQSMPFGRPQADELLGGAGFVIDAQYPARGGE